MSDVETDDGACPECGAPLMGSNLFDPNDASRDPFESGFGSDEEDDVVGKNE